MKERKCECGCGESAGFYASDGGKNRHRKGESKRFISGHNNRLPGAGRSFEPLETRYEVRDCGYETPCWIWLRAKTGKGYGHMWSPEAGRLVVAHRYYYERFVEPIPKGLQIDHLCRVHACVNPWHMEPVTQYVNQQRGANAKLTREQADEIRQRGRARLTLAIPRNQPHPDSLVALSREFGVSPPVVKGIVEGHLWR